MCFLFITVYELHKKNPWGTDLPKPPYAAEWAAALKPQGVLRCVGHNANGTKCEGKPPVVDVDVGAGRDGTFCNPAGWFHQPPRGFQLMSNDPPPISMRIEEFPCSY